MIIFANPIARFLTNLVSVALLILALILTLFLIKETLILAKLLLHSTALETHLLAENIVVWFLFFEFLALIAKYFQSGFHFPLRYFIYIGITAIVRLIIVNHADPTNTLWYSLAILILLLALYLANTPLLRRN